jgi:dienelactone hydrolase
MRPLEVCLLVFGLLAALSLLSNRSRQIGRILVLLSLVVLAAHAIVEGAHWQMIPAYLALALLCVAGWKRVSGGRRLLRVSACVLALLLLGASVAASYVLPMFRLPKPTGSYPVGTTILYLKDGSRVDDAAPVAGQPRELMVQVWYPAAASSNRWARYREPRETNLLSSYQTAIATDSRLNAPVADAGAPFPVIVFNHGWGSRRTNDTFLTEELASHGYVVASIDHTYNASLVAFPDGRQVRSNASGLIGDAEGSTPDEVRAVWNKELAKQEADERFVLDRLAAMSRDAGSPWHGRLNTNLAGAIGHSFGGAASTDFCALDPRVRGSVNMDGWFFGAIEARGPNQPLMYLNTSGDEIGQPSNPAAKVSAALNTQDGIDLLHSLRSYGGYVVTLKGAEHVDFTDQGLVSPLRSVSHAGTISASEAEAIVRAYVVAFFDKTLRGQDPKILRDPASPFPDATFETWTGSGAGNQVKSSPQAAPHGP